MLLVFIAFIALVNYLLNGFGSITNINDWILKNTVYSNLSLELIFRIYIFTFHVANWGRKRRLYADGTTARN
ncbi:MAG: hypothetical protein CM15mP129_00920 [Chloroflexota bacterium]|nr:MAG: hypothetical protein CM15mP129_00920 [Chloroflexota bacterium]